MGVGVRVHYEIHRSLIALRIKNGLTIQDLSVASRVTVGEVCHLERENFTEYAGGLDKIFAAYGVDLPPILVKAIDLKLQEAPSAKPQNPGVQPGFLHVLSEFRKIKKSTVSNLAMVSGVDEKKLKLIFDGEVNPLLKAFERLLHFYGINIVSEITVALDSVQVMPLCQSTRDHDEGAFECQGFDGVDKLIHKDAVSSAPQLLQLYRRRIGRGIDDVCGKAGIKINDLHAFETLDPAMHCPMLLKITKALGIDFSANLIVALNDALVDVSSHPVLNISFGRHLVLARETLNLSIAQLAESAGVVCSIIRRLEHGERVRNISKFESLMNYYGINSNTLFSYDGKPNVQPSTQDDLKGIRTVSADSLQVINLFGSDEVESCVAPSDEGNYLDKIKLKATDYYGNETKLHISDNDGYYIICSSDGFFHAKLCQSNMGSLLVLIRGLFDLSTSDLAIIVPALKKWKI